MQIKAVGQAKIKHKTSHVVYTINSDELVWDDVEKHEDGMGTLTLWEAIIDHPELGDISWQVWEYPKEIIETDNHNFNGHELLENFTFQTENINRINIDMMKEWFLSNYEDPALHLSYDHEEDTYIWTRKPHEAFDVMSEEYDSNYDPNTIYQAALEVSDEHGVEQWVNIHERDDEYLNEDDDQIEEEAEEANRLFLNEQINVTQSQIQNISNELLTAIQPILDFENTNNKSLIDILNDKGHNNPPLEESLFYKLNINIKSMLDDIKPYDTSDINTGALNTTAINTSAINENELNLQFTSNFKFNFKNDLQNKNKSLIHDRDEINIIVNKFDELIKVVKNQSTFTTIAETVILGKIFDILISKVDTLDKFNLTTLMNSIEIIKPYLYYIMNLIDALYMKYLYFFTLFQ